MPFIFLDLRPTPLIRSTYITVSLCISKRALSRDISFLNNTIQIPPTTYPAWPTNETTGVEIPLPEDQPKTREKPKVKTRNTTDSIIHRRILTRDLKVRRRGLGSPNGTNPKNRGAQQQNRYQRHQIQTQGPGIPRGRPGLYPCEWCNRTNHRSEDCRNRSRKQNNRRQFHCVDKDGDVISKLCTFPLLRLTFLHG